MILHATFLLGHKIGIFIKAFSSTPPQREGGIVHQGREEHEKNAAALVHRLPELPAAQINIWDFGWG